MPKYITSKSGSNHPESYVYFIAIRCEDKIVIPLQRQSYVLNLNYTYLLLTRIDRTETKIHKHLCWCGNGKSIRKEVSNCDN